MSEPVHASEDQLREQLRVQTAIMESLLRQVVDTNVASVTRMHTLDASLHKIETILPAISNLTKRVDSLEGALKDLSALPGRLEAILEKLSAVSPASETTDNIQSKAVSGIAGLPEFVERISAQQSSILKELSAIPQQLEGLLEKVGSTTRAAPESDKWNELSKFPEMVERIESQQSTILQTLEKRVDPRLMIYLKPLIEMLEEEGRQAEQLKNAALQQLHDLLLRKTPRSDQEISTVLEKVNQEIRRCTESFERTQQALQIVVTPFQNVGRLFRNNLEIVVQAHDLMAQLYEDLPRFLGDMKKGYEDQLNT